MLKLYILLYKNIPTESRWRDHYHLPTITCKGELLHVHQIRRYYVPLASLNAWHVPKPFSLLNIFVPLLCLCPVCLNYFGHVLNPGGPQSRKTKVEKKGGGASNMFIKNTANQLGLLHYIFLSPLFVSMKQCHLRSVYV